MYEVTHRYFSSDKLKTDVPHYFICIAKDDGEILILACATSQFEKRKRFIELRGFPESTLVWIDPENGFTKDSYIDCKNYYDYTLTRFKSLYQSDKLEYKGKISEAHLEQIHLGIKDSPQIEESIKELIEKHLNP